MTARWPCALALACAVLLVLGCSREPQWRTKSIAGLMPDLAFTLTGEDGAAVTAEDFRGKVNLLYFGYTSCPDVCPITLSRLRGVLASLDSSTRERVRVLFVSVDPRRDDPARLRQYTDAFGPSFIGLTGTPEQLDRLTKRYRTTYGYGAPDPEGGYEVSHSSAVFAFDPQGRARLLIRSDDDQQAIVDDVSQLTRLG